MNRSALIETIRESGAACLELYIEIERQASEEKSAGTFSEKNRAFVEVSREHVLRVEQNTADFEKAIAANVSDSDLNLLLDERIAIDEKFLENSKATI
jgi:hypothetical protein